jgi:glycosyltransferase involved in cell wall biosynthesis
VLVVAKSLATGGAERLISELASLPETPEFTYEYAYVASDGARFANVIRSNGRTIHDLGGSENEFDLAWVLRLWKVIRQGHYDVIHTHAPSTSALVRVLNRLSAFHRASLVHTAHNRWSKSHFVTRTLNRLTLGLCDAIVAVSADTASSYPRRTQLKVHLIIHGINIERFAQIGRHRPPHLIVGTAARLVPIKNLDLLIKAATQINSPSNWQMHVAGHGPERARLELLVESLGLSHRISFLGEVENIAGFLDTLSIFALSSTVEGLPVALMEAMASGLPIVSTEVGGIPQMIGDSGGGFLVPSNSITVFAAALQQLIDSPVQRRSMGDAARRRSFYFDVRRSRTELEDLYTNILNHSDLLN